MRNRHLSLLPLLVLLACSSGDSAALPGATSITATSNAAPREMVHFSIPSNETTMLGLRVADDAECTIEGAPEPIDLVADAHGVLNLGVKLSAPDAPIPLACTRSDGTVDRYSLAIDIATSPAAAITRNFSDSERTQRAVRPALAVDPMTLSDDELLSRGFPPPPNRDPSTPGFARWRELTQVAASPMTAHKARSVYSSGLERSRKRSATPASSASSAFSASNGETWSGYMASPSWSVTEALGTWTVPAVTASGASRMGEWVGLGGYYSDDSNNLEGLAQAGTMGQTNIFGRTQITNYDAWVEYLPSTPELLVPMSGWAQAPNGWTVAVRPGDQYTVLTWVGLPATTAWFWFTTTEAATGAMEYYYGSAPYVVTPGYTSCQGWSAEWIVEDPTGQMPNFGITTISGASAYGDGQTLTIGDNDGPSFFYASSGATMLDYPFQYPGAVEFLWFAQ